MAPDRQTGTSGSEAGNHPGRGMVAALLMVLFMLPIPPGAAAHNSGGDARNSIYQLDVDLAGHDGVASGLDRYAGQPVVISMFYGSCPHICPMLISSIKAAEQQLPEAQRDGLRVLMISLDAERDTPESLAKVAEQHEVPETRWTLASAGESDVRKIAAVLGIRFRKLPDGNFNHTSEMILLDAQGREITRSDKLGVPAESFVSVLLKATAE